MWSSAVNLALMAGGDLGQIHRFLSVIRENPKLNNDTNAWTNAWNAMAEQQKTLAEEDVRRGHTLSASARYLRASIYHLTGERQTPLGPQKLEAYMHGVEAFSRANELSDNPVEKVEIQSPDGILPGYLISPRVDHQGRNPSSPAPVVIFYNGFDVTKEILFAIIRHEFSRRCIACLVVDTPGTGEPLRLRGVPSRYDYEVPTAAVVDFIESRADLDKSRIGLLGISLGGYYSMRGAAFEARIKACVAWGAIWDYGTNWQNRWDTATDRTSVPFWQLPWVMGTDNMADALVKVRKWNLADALPHLKQPLLIVHGADDAGIPLEDAYKAFSASATTDKELKIFTTEEGSSEHVGSDDPDPSRQFIADWFALHL